jgi:hypothetical protein
VSPAHPNDGIPHSRRVVTVPPGGTSREETWSGANDAKDAKLRHKRLQQRVRAEGVQLRHSSSGYALIDAGRRPVDDRNDLTLDEVEAWLERA